MSEILVRAKLAAIVLAAAGSLTLLSSGSISANAARATSSAWPGRLPASITASGKVRASLSKKSFTAAEARTVKLVYIFAPTSKRFSYQLSKQTGSAWLKLRVVARKGRFGGSHSKTLKSIFGSKPLVAASYRIDLSADANRVRLSFKIVASAPLPNKPAKTVKLIFIHHSTG
jgi:hypothetical protein